MVRIALDDFHRGHIRPDEQNVLDLVGGCAVAHGAGQGGGGELGDGGPAEQPLTVAGGPGSGRVTPL